MISIIEGYLDDIMDMARGNIEAGEPFKIPTVHEALLRLPDLAQDLIEAYNREVCEGYTYEDYGIDKNIALMQAVLNDTVITSASGKHYTNNGPDLLGIDGRYQRKLENVLEANRNGICKAYCMTTRFVPNRDQGIGLVRTRETFQSGKFSIYSVYRSYFEYILEWCRENGVRVTGDNVCDVVITFNSKIGERYRLSISSWDENHERLKKDGDIFNARNAVFDTRPCSIRAYTNNERVEEVNLMRGAVITPVMVDELYECFGGGPLDQYSTAILNEFILRVDTEQGDYRLPNGDRWLLDMMLRGPVYARDIENLRNCIPELDRFMNTFDRFKLGSVLTEDALDKELKKGAVFLLFNSECSRFNGAYTCNKGLLRELYGEKYKDKETNFDKNRRKLYAELKKGCIPQDYKEYISGEEMGSDGFGMVMDMLDPTGTQANIFRTKTVRAYAITDGYKDQGKCSEMYAIYLPLEYIEEARVCERRVHRLSAKNDGAVNTQRG